jgi:phospholipid/cholesterol/gamma-HCH transport system substrate-binding protein
VSVDFSGTAARVGALTHSVAVRVSAAIIMVAAAVALGLGVAGGTPSYHLNVVYASAPGLFPGAAVDVLGVPVGTVTSVRNVADRVEVGMQVHSGERIPAKAFASLVAPELLGQPDVDLNPGYTGGAFLQPGATIPEQRTSVPVSTDELLKQLQRTLRQLNPHAVGDLVTNLAQDLSGQGTGLNNLLATAAGTLQLLADKGVALGQLNGTLAQLTGTLDSDTSQIEQLVREYDTVSTVIAQHAGPLGDAITQLAGASTALVGLLTPNLQPLESDVGTVTTVGRTLDRNISNIDGVLQQSNNLFQGAQRVFDPTYNWLNLNLALPPGVTGDYVAGLIRDRLAGVCRRIVANHSSGLTPTMLSSLNACGDPNSGFFDPLLNEIPALLSALSGSGSSAAGTAILQQGLSQIGSIGVGSASGTTPSGSGSSSSTTPTTTPSTTPTTPSTTTPTTTPSSCGLLGMLLGCPGGASNSSQGGLGSSGTSSSGTSSSGNSSSGVAGLLSADVQSTRSRTATRRPAASTPAAPTLTAPAARFLPPLHPRHASAKATKRHRHRHRHRHHATVVDHSVKHRRGGQ